MISTELTNQNTSFYVAIFSSDTRVSKTAFSVTGRLAVSDLDK